MRPVLLMWEFTLNAVKGLSRPRPGGRGREQPQSPNRTKGGILHGGTQALNILLLSGVCVSAVRPSKMKKSPPTPLECAVAQKCVRNSFGIRTYKSLDLKSPGMNTYRKHRGVGGLRVLQTQDLGTLFLARPFILLSTHDFRPKHTAIPAAPRAEPMPTACRCILRVSRDQIVPQGDHLDSSAALVLRCAVDTGPSRARPSRAGPSRARPIRAGIPVACWRARAAAGSCAAI